MASRYLSSRFVSHAKLTFTSQINILNRNYYADTAVTVGTPQERNSESFQVNLILICFQVLISLIFFQLYLTSSN